MILWLTFALVLIALVFYLTCDLLKISIVLVVQSAIGKYISKHTARRSSRILFSWAIFSSLVITGASDAFCVELLLDEDTEGALVGSTGVGFVEVEGGFREVVLMGQLTLSPEFDEAPASVLKSLEVKL